MGSESEGKKERKGDVYHVLYLTRKHDSLRGGMFFFFFFFELTHRLIRS